METDREKIFKANHRTVYQLCYRMTRNHADADEITQEVFIEVFANLEKFRGESKLSTWIYRIACRVCHRRRSRNDKRCEMPLETWDKAVEPYIIDNLTLRQMISQLPQDCKSMFIQHAVYGYTFREIAEKIGVTMPTVNAKVYKAQLRMRQMRDSGSRTAEK